MPDKTWKAVERAYARLFNVRQGRTGPQGENWPDVIGSWFTLEVKHREHLPKWLLDAMQQATHNTDLRAPTSLPLVVLHGKGMRYLDGLVLLRVKDFLQWFGSNDDEMPESSVQE